MRFYRILLWVQSLYILITALWPLVHIENFMEVTGYKTDVWLVKTVGALLLPISATLFLHLIKDLNPLTAVVLGSLTALAFATIDFYYALNDVISDIYVTDGVVEIIFILGWLYVYFTLPFHDRELK